MAEFIEAAARAGTPSWPLTLTSSRGHDGGQRHELGLGIAARSGALLVEGQRANDLYVEAIYRLSRCRIAIDLARAHLVYGEWLRRERRRIDARTELRTARTFLEFGMSFRRARSRGTRGDRGTCP